jgi:hypothetical protein
LIDILDLGAVVTEITDSVSILIALIRIGDEGAVILGEADLIEVFVTTREPNTPLEAIA